MPVRLPVHTAPSTTTTTTTATKLVVAFVALFAAGCGPAGSTDATATVARVSDGLAYNELNGDAGQRILYELQPRTANACRPDVGSAAQRAACTAKPAPAIAYHGQGTSCDSLADLQSIRLGTLDDMVENTADFRAGITVRYVDERAGANALWLMPLFPNNDAWGLPDACDNLGSPYAVRDYFHVAGTLSRSCIAAGRDERSAQPCWGDDALDRVLAAAHARGMKVLLDVALNHFGHNYLFYDLAGATPVRERVARGENLDNLWDFAATEDAALLHPRVADDATALAGPDADAVRARCPALAGQALVRAVAEWRDAFDWERARFSCDDAALEYQLPGYYVGGNAFDPSTGVGDNYTNNWSDVKFLFHHEDNVAHQWEYVRTREYLVRILDYWLARGVDGFRLDHTTDPASGLAPNEWKYVTDKLDYYQYRRGAARPIFLAEEFGDQMGMAHVSDIMTEGYVRDMTGRDGETKDAGYVASVLGNMGRFGGHTFVMTALETHDEHRLTDGTGFDAWTGAGFWGIGATTWSTPMMLVGQEFGESQPLSFRRSSIIDARFSGSGPGDALVDFYGAMARARRDGRNRALRATGSRVLLTRDGNAMDPRLYVAARWSDDGNAVFVAHNLWPVDVAQSYYLPPDVTAAIGLDANAPYRLVDAVSGQTLGACRTGADLAWDFYVAMGAGTRMQWMRLERC